MMQRPPADKFEFHNYNQFDDPFSVFEGWRNEYGNIFQDDNGTWHVLGHPEVMAIFAVNNGTDFVKQKAATFSPEQIAQMTMPTMPEQITKFYSNALVFMYGPEHARVRKVMKEAIGRKASQKWVETIQTMSNKFFSELKAKGSGDYIQEYTLLLTTGIIGDILGIPDENAQDVARWTKQFFLGSDVHATNEQKGALVHGLINMWNFFAGIVEDRRTGKVSRIPNDFITLLLMTHHSDHGGQLTTDQVIAAIMLMYIGGFETNTHLIANSTLVLLRPENSSQRELLVSNPSLIPNAYLELARYAGPTGEVTLYKKGDGEVASVSMKNGQQVKLYIGAANRDSRVFENPHRLNITRKNLNQSLAFGYGLHFCGGYELANIEGVSALTTIAPHLHSMSVPSYTRRQTLQLYAMEDMQVVFSNLV